MITYDLSGMDMVLIAEMIAGRYGGFPEPLEEAITTHASPDIILLDLNLPRVDGFSVLEILKNELKSPPPPILILSSSATTGDIERSYEKGCDAYLTKPNSMSEFMSLSHSIKNFWIDAVRTPQARS